ncbi:YbjQ family protein [Rhizomonospora bruguierae]|uniref:YbjQ family protein n=1 Tax=Rhizomonospora bruguierae TaxID=1581705 RepID=UPI001BD0A10C|nr:heavy metal-binding domain-containing protein [Micromonospora sp. NBRC 107566]
MLVVTTDELPGYLIRRVVGQVIGICARTYNPFTEGVRTLWGDPNPAIAEVLARWRQEAVDNMITGAQKKGANAVVAMRFDHREVTTAWVEICAYGTAVVIADRAAVEREEQDRHREQERRDRERQEHERREREREQPALPAA